MSTNFEQRLGADDRLGVDRDLYPGFDAQADAGPVGHQRDVVDLAHRHATDLHVASLAQPLAGGGERAVELVPAVEGTEARLDADGRERHQQQETDGPRDHVAVAFGEQAGHDVIP